MICGHGHKQKFRYPYPRDSKKFQMPYPRAKAIDQNPTLCPASPPAGLTLIGALYVKCRLVKCRLTPASFKLLLFYVLHVLFLVIIYDGKVITALLLDYIFLLALLRSIMLVS